MTGEKQLTGNSDHSDSMVFGFDRITDERSLAIFLQKIAGSNMLDTLVPRLEEQEIENVLQLFTGLMKKHLSKSEYHRLFLGDSK